MAFVITGSPGVGKHEVARRLAAALDLETVDLSRAAAGPGVAERSADGALDVDVGRLADAVRGSVSGRSLVVGHLAPHVLARSQVGAAVVLRRSPYRLDGTYRERGYPEPKRMENLGSEILGVVAYDAVGRFGADRVTQIDTTDRSAGEAAGIARDALRGAGVPGDRVDWLGLVGSRGDMDRFFPTC